MRKSITLFLVTMVFFSIASLHSQTPSSVLDLYLLIGQSNMAGRGIITSEYVNEGHPRVWMLTKQNKWEPAKHPLHFDKPAIVGVGPGLSFGIKMATANPSHNIGLIPCAVGGTPIDAWKPGAYDPATKTHPYDDMLVRLAEAQKSGVVKGILWLQGEADSGPGKLSTYLPKLKELIERLRLLLNDERVPFVAGEIGRFKEPFINFNTELSKLPTRVSYTAIASSEEFMDKGDSTHFNSASAQKFGERFAEQMKQLQKASKKGKKKRI